MNPVPADVRKLMYRVKKAQGVDITRIFCGLNDTRNIIPSIVWAKEAGMIAQATLCITYSPVHTAEYYIKMAEELIAAGADEICLKDMAGIGRPETNGKIVRAIKERHPNIPVQYHGHTGPGFSVASMLEVAKAGVDYLDVAMEPLSWGMVHPDVITIVEMLKDAGFDVPEINMNAYMKVRELTQSFIDDFLGYFIDERNRFMNSLLITCGLPGGMMGSLMADLKGVHAAINANLKKDGKAELTEDELLIQLFNEVKFVWPKLGYPPLVTPFSQYVKNVALMNIFSMSKGGGRYEMMDQATWNMILGKAGNLPGPLDKEIIELAKKNKFEFSTTNPQDNYPDELPRFIKEMEELGWDRGPDDEELFEFAMHEKQYREYKSGEAKKRFYKELEAAMNKQNAAAPSAAPVKLDLSEMAIKRHPDAEPINATAAGVVMWELDFEDISLKPENGKMFKEGDLICAIQTPANGLEFVYANYSGKIIDAVEQGKIVKKGDVIGFFEKK